MISAKLKLLAFSASVLALAAPAHATVNITLSTFMSGTIQHDIDSDVFDEVHEFSTFSNVPNVISFDLNENAIFIFPFIPVSGSLQSDFPYQVTYAATQSAADGVSFGNALGRLDFSFNSTGLRLFSRFPFIVPPQGPYTQWDTSIDIAFATTPTGTDLASLVAALDTSSFSGTSTYTSFQPSPLQTEQVQRTYTISATPLVAAVPEPASWGLLVGGLGVMGAIQRRRRREAVRFA